MLIIGKEFSDFDRTNERLDLLAVDSYGRLVIIELKRDDTGADAHWQAIKYASYLHRAGIDEIVSMMADYQSTSQEEAKNRLMVHLGADDLNAVNNDQRIMLVSHRFAPEVTSAALWLNEKAMGENLIACVKLTPYKDDSTNSLYVQATTIIPVPGVDEYVVKVGRNLQRGDEPGNRFAAKLQATIDRNRNDSVTSFLSRVRDLVVDELPEPIRPDKTSRWAGAHSYGGRYYHFWYSGGPWSNWGTSYRINLWPKGDDLWEANVEFSCNMANFEAILARISIREDQNKGPYNLWVVIGSGMLDDSFGNEIADMTRDFIETITPIVNDLENETGDQ